MKTITSTKEGKFAKKASGYFSYSNMQRESQQVQEKVCIFQWQVECFTCDAETV